MCCGVIADAPVASKKLYSATRRHYITLPHVSLFHVQATQRGGARGHL